MKIKKRNKNERDNLSNQSKLLGYDRAIEMSRKYNKKQRKFGYEK